MRPTFRPFLVLFPLLVALGALPAAAEVKLVSAADFHNADGSGHVFTDFSGFIQPGNGFGHLVAPVDLPDGAVVTAMTAWLGDSEDAGNFSVALMRKRRGNSVPLELLSQAVTNGINPAGQQLVQGSAVTNGVIDDLYVYYLTTALNPMDSTSQRIYSISISYARAIFSDGFESGDTSAWGAPPSTSGRKWLSGADFSVATKSTSWPWSFDPSLATYSLPNASAGSTPPCGVAPLELPHGATVTGFLANLYDSRADRGLTLSLRRSPINSLVASTVMAQVVSAAVTGWQLRSDFSVTDAVLDNDSYWYYFELCMTGGNTAAAGELAVQAVEILYTLP